MVLRNAEILLASFYEIFCLLRAYEENKISTNMTSTNGFLVAMVAMVALVTASNIGSGVYAWGINRSGISGATTKCERLTVSLCQGLRYNLTAMPNFMGHTDQLQAERGVITIIIMLC